MGSIWSIGVETYSKLGLKVLVLALIGEPGYFDKFALDLIPLDLNDDVYAISFGVLRFLIFAVTGLGDPANLLILAVLTNGLASIYGGPFFKVLGDPIPLKAFTGFFITCALFA